MFEVILDFLPEGFTNMRAATRVNGELVVVSFAWLMTLPDGSQHFTDSFATGRELAAQLLHCSEEDIVFSKFGKMISVPAPN
jgi:hypothetical protein